MNYSVEVTATVRDALGDDWRIEVGPDLEGALIEVRYYDHAQSSERPDRSFTLPREAALSLSYALKLALGVTP